jgi:rhomboid protease GluP
MPGLMFGKKICQWCVQHEAAQRGEVDDHAKQPVMTAPWVRRESSVTLTQVIFGANIAVFLAMVFASGNPIEFLNPLHEFTPQVSIPYGAMYGPLAFSGQWWRLLTYMFLHGSLLHIAFNMWCLWDLGALCEALYGRATFAAVYLITGVAGGLASIAWNPGVWTVGASGAIFGLAGALIASFYLGEFSLPRVAIQGTLKSLVFFVGFNVLFGSLFPGIDNACHAGGVVSGLILGAVIARFAPEHDRPLRRAGAVLFVVLILAVSGLAVNRWRGSGIRYERSIRAQRNLDEMIAALQKKIQKNPQDAAAHYALAHEYIVKGQTSDAEAELKRVLELQPQNADARMDLGASYLIQDRIKEAKEEFAKILAQDANNADAHVGMGMALANEKNHAAAVNEYKAALQTEPKLRGVNYRLGISQAELKQYDDAIASFLKERDASGDGPQLESALADAYQAKGMTQQAEEARNKAAQLGDGHE